MKIDLHVCAIAFACSCALASDEAETASVNVATRDELMQAVRTARPGMKILLAPGKYEGGLSFSNLQGKDGEPIVLAAAKLAAV